MKKIGTYTARGRVPADDSLTRINVFDGDYKTGYKITRISISPADIDSQFITHLFAKVQTTDVAGTANSWDWGNNQEVAWAYYAHDANGIFPLNFNDVDRDNLIIEDCYIQANDVSGAADVELNYIIEFDKYELGSLRGTLAMVQNRSQG